MPNGPCYMKRGIGASQYNAGIWGARSVNASALQMDCSNPGVNQTTYTSFNGRVYLIECDIDHYDSDFSDDPQYVRDLQECIVRCDSTSDCLDVSLSGRACYRK